MIEKLFPRRTLSDSGHLPYNNGVDRVSILMPEFETRRGGKASVGEVKGMDARIHIVKRGNGGETTNLIARNGVCQTEVNIRLLATAGVRFACSLFVVEGNLHCCLPNILA